MSDQKISKIRTKAWHVKCPKCKDISDFTGNDSQNNETVLYEEWECVNDKCDQGRFELIYILHELNLTPSPDFKDIKAKYKVNK